MKCGSVLFILFAFLFACKKDKADNKQLLLSKVYEDGLLNYEYQYSADKKPQRRNVYNTNSGQSVYAGFRLYQYENGLPKEVSDFNASNNFWGKYTIQYDINKRPSRLDYYNSSNTRTPITRWTIMPMANVPAILFFWRLQIKRR